MNKIWLVALALPLVFQLAPQAEATTCPGGAAVTFTEYLALAPGEDGGCTIGYKVFFDFDLSGDLSASQVSVDTIAGPANFGFIFGMDFIAGGAEDAVALLQISYNVRTIDGESRITGVAVEQTSAALGVADALVSEDVCAGAYLPIDDCAAAGGTPHSLQTSTQDETDHVVFAEPVARVGVLKELLAFSFCASDPSCELPSFATIRFLENTVSETVPEPATLLLLGSGLVGLATWGRGKLRK